MVLGLRTKCEKRVDKSLRMCYLVNVTTTKYNMEGGYRLPENCIIHEAKKQVQNIPPLKLHPAVGVRVIIQGENHCEVTFMQRPTSGISIQKLNADEYLDLKTGEVCLFNKNDMKQKRNLSLTFRELTSLIRTNFDAGNQYNQLFVTLTYAENMQDHNKLYVDYRDFFKRLKYHHPDHTLDYIAVAEPQGRGAWHFHVMLKSDKTIYIDNRDMEKLWGHGYTKTERLKSDDVGRYYVAYFTDLFGEIGSTAKKKGARLPLYPVGMKFYRCSAGIRRPENMELTYGEVLEQWGKPDYKTTYEVRDDAGDIIQVIQREHFKKGYTNVNNENNRAEKDKL